MWGCGYMDTYKRVVQLKLVDLRVDDKTSTEF